MSIDPWGQRRSIRQWPARHPQVVVAALGLGPAAGLGIVTALTFGTFWPGWFLGILVGLGLRQYVASRRPDLVPSTTEPTQRWQVLLVAVLVIATAALVVIALSR